jgi:hypothetical protein
LKERWHASMWVATVLQLGMYHYRQTFRILSAANKFVIKGVRQIHQTTCKEPYYNGILTYKTPVNVTIRNKWTWINSLTTYKEPYYNGVFYI